MNIFTSPGKKIVSLTILLYVFSAGCARNQSRPQERESLAYSRHPVPEYMAVPGTRNAVREATLFTENLPALRSTMRIRMMTVLPVDVEFRTSSEAVFEVRSGGVITKSDGGWRELHPGEMWMVAKGARVRMRATKEFAVVRAIDVVPLAANPRL